MRGVLSERWSDLRYRLRALLDRDALERELDEELRFHLERETEKLAAAGVPPSCFQLEVTETVFLGRGAEYVETALKALSRAGVRIALDDFGTGYSSLYHLRELKFDKLKIDRSYVDAITMSDERAKLADAIIKLGTSLGLFTTAEGIETDASLDWLSDQGCHFGQGYLFGHAMPKAEMDVVLSAGGDAVGPTDGLALAS